MASEESTEEDTPENQSEPSSESYDSDDEVSPVVDPVADLLVDPVVDPVLKECIQCPLNEINNDQSLLFKEGDVMKNISDDSFIPATEFDFGHPNEKAHNIPLSSKVVKRKKCKKNEVGRSSLNYISNNESQNLGKKPKNILEDYLEEDIFGLNPLLGLDDNVTTGKNNGNSVQLKHLI
ncbi:hypothetical protein Hanom_Chr16g01462581 [Helianthus anomalus]